MMNLHDKAAFERQLMRYNAAKGTSREHNERCDLVTWVAALVKDKCELAAIAALEEARVNAGPIADTSGGP